MVTSNYRFIPPDHIIIPAKMLFHIAKLVDTMLTLEGQGAVLDAHKALLIADLAKATELFVSEAKV